MKIVIPGGSGQVGVMLARAFHPQDEVVVLSRTAFTAPWRTVEWSPPRLGDWLREIDGADVVINLAGRSVNCRYGEKNRREIIDSRVDSVRAIGDAIVRAKDPPRVWLQASTATIYAHTFGAANDEYTGVVGGSEPDAPDTWKFSINVATEWEHAVDEFKLPKTRIVKLRSAMTMSPDEDGIFATLLNLVRFGMGGSAGSGRQFISWIHETDFVNAVRLLIERKDISGAVNVCAPNPLPNRDFMAELRRAYGATIGLPATEWMLALGAVFMRTETELILKSRKVVPKRLMDAGFKFEYPEWSGAARELCARWRRFH